jgi:ADP-ribose pyrophosphatase YjhB (NUDIX family)
MNTRKTDYCPRCGTRLEERERYGKLRPVCPNCDHTVFYDPKVAVAGFVTRGDEVLLVKRILDPGKGKWALPAGFVDAEEDPRRAVERETLEETGLVVETEHLLDLLHRPDADGLADIVIAYSARVTGGLLIASDDAEEAGWFSKDNLPEIALATTNLLIRRWIEGDFGDS